MTLEGRDSPDLARIFDCPHCHRPVYPATEWKRMTTEQRRLSGGRSGIGGMCSSCYAHPAARDPEPGSEYVEPECDECGTDMVTQAQWRKADEAERAELTDEGYTVAQNANQCVKCYQAAKYPLPDDPAEREHSLKIRRGMQRDFEAEYRAAIAGGAKNMSEVGAILDLHPSNVLKRVKRLRAAGVDISAPKRSRKKVSA